MTKLKISNDGSKVVDADCGCGLVPEPWLNQMRKPQEMLIQLYFDLVLDDGQNLTNICNRYLVIDNDGLSNEDNRCNNL